MNIYLDIETLPTTDPDIIKELASKITAPAQYKKPESIAEWMAENKERMTKEAVAKTSFDGLYGRIACICYAFDDGEVYVVDDDDESVLLANLYSHISDMTSKPYHGGVMDMDAVFIGHNLAGFDLPFLKHRSVINRVKPVPTILKAMSAKPWDNCISDTMLMWSQDREKRVSMDKLCRAFGIPGKCDFDGSMVAETWPVDRQRVIEYCKDDVIRTREIYKRITWKSERKESEAKAEEDQRGKTAEATHAGPIATVTPRHPQPVHPFNRPTPESASSSEKSANGLDLR